MPTTVFADRAEAGRMLGEQLRTLGLAEPGTIVAGIPRGGIVVAAEVARTTQLPLRAVLARKVGAPGHRELAIGAVGPDGSALLDDDLLARIGIGPDWAARAVDEQREAVRELAARFPHVVTADEVKGQSLIVVDDGVATGATAATVGAWLRLAGVGKSVLALPVGAPSTVERLAETYDHLVVLAQPRAFLAVGQWYRDFTQTSDEQVVELLEALGDPAG